MRNMDVCRFCGQAFVPNDEDAPEGVRLDSGTSKCDCEEAKKWNRRRMFIASAQDKLQDVLKYKFNEAAENEALNKSEGENKIYDFLQEIIPFMVDGDIPSVTLKIKGTGKVSMTVASDGQIKIKRQISSAIEQKASEWDV